jgi:hypothetical protein
VSYNEIIFMQNVVKPGIWSEIWDDRLSFLNTGIGLRKKHIQKNAIVNWESREQVCCVERIWDDSCISYLEPVSFKQQIFLFVPYSKTYKILSFVEEDKNKNDNTCFGSDNV